MARIEMLVRVQVKGGEIKDVIVRSDDLTANESATLVTEIAQQLGVDVTPVSARQLM